MRIAVRTAAFLVLLAVAWFLYSQVRAAGSAETPDASRTIVLFGCVVVFGAFFIIVAEFWFLPIIGERIGNFFYGSNETFVRSPHAAAQAKVALGDYVAAIEEYRRCYKKDPSDALALSEMARLQCERLQDYEVAAELLEEALNREWPAEQAAFLASRLTEVYWNYLHDAGRARQVLLQIVESVPGTRHAASAEHRLREIEQAVVGLPDRARDVDAVAPASPDDAAGQPAHEPEEGLGEAGQQDNQGKAVDGEGEGA